MNFDSWLTSSKGKVNTAKKKKIKSIEARKRTRYAPHPSPFIKF